MSVLVIEVERFDMARMKDPQIHVEMYQRGAMYDAESLKAYVFARDGYRCACCGKKAGTIRKDGTVVKLAIHHILFRSRGATDNPKCLSSACDSCHTAEAHKPGEILYEWMEQEKQFTRGLRDAAFMNILRRRLFQAFPEATFTYGNITAADRKRLLLSKGHANDAIAIPLQGKNVDHLKNQCQTLHYKQVRKSKRSLQEATSRKGRREPNREAKRNWKNTTEAKGFRLWDTVYVNGQKLHISGFTGTSAYLVDWNGCYVSPPGKNYKQWSLSKLRRLHPNGGWLVS